ncbi:hypothetical protein Hanom_Chr06g00555591 [Helianthus anomalus]
MQKQFDKFLQDYQNPGFLNPKLPALNKPIYLFLPGKFPLYTRVCNFVNYRIPFTKYLIKVLQFFRVHLSQVNPFGLSRINHFEISYRALGQKPDLDVVRKSIPSPASQEKLSLKNWKDHFFWPDDLCFPANMVWRF